MRCDHFLEAIEAYVDRELPTADRVAAEEHFRSCPKCEQALHERLALRNLLREQLEAIAPADLKEALLNSVDTSPVDSAPIADSPSRPQSAGRTGFFERLRELLVYRPLVPAAATVALAAIIWMAVPWWNEHRSAAQQFAAFSRPASVFVLRYGESPAGVQKPELVGFTLSNPLKDARR